jgi:ABC-type phosphate transport system substrate-binding protein
MVVTGARIRRGLRAGVALAGAVGLLMAATPAAHATPSTIIAAAGSDTTQNVMDQILKAYGGTGAGYYDIPSVPSASGFGVPGDAYCTNGSPGTQQVTWVPATNETGSFSASGGATTVVAPNGSAYGNNEIGAELYGAATSAGCIDIGRASSLQSFTVGSSNVVSNFAFGLDAISWASPSLNAPTHLSVTDIKNIYQCKANDWSDVGGSPGPIVRYLPQLGSGTGQTFKQYILGIGSNDDASTLPTSGTDAYTSNPITCPPAVEVQPDVNVAGSTLTLANGTSFTAADVGAPVTATSGGTVPPGTTVSAFIDANHVVINAPVTGSGFVSVTVGARNLIVAFSNTATSHPMFEENEGREIAKADYQSAILPVSAGQFAYQAAHASNTTVDLRNGVRLGAISCTTSETGCSTSATGTPSPKFAVTWDGADGLFQIDPMLAMDGNAVGIAGNTPSYPGVRYVWNDLYQGSPNHTAALSLVGFQNTLGGFKSPLCNGALSATIASFGFLPLNTNNDAGNHNLAGSTCRNYGVDQATTS